MKIEDHTILAWVGLDEHGKGRIGIKQGLLIPLVAMDYDEEKLKRLLPLMDEQAATFGNKIRLVRFRFEAIVEETEHGS